MVLFESDFQAYGAIPDTSTRNQSFIKMAVLLERMGIKNNKFFLALHDQDLVGIDPHHLNDPSMELRLRISTEAKLNYWYYIRECVKVKISGDSEPGPYLLNRANLGLAWCFFNDVATFETIPRQMGKTIAVMTITGHVFYLSGSNLDIGLLAKETKLVQDNVRRLKDVAEWLPDYMVFPQNEDTNNKEGVSYTIHNTLYKTYVPIQSKDAATGMARGATLAYVHIDELPYCKLVYLSYNPFLATTTKAQPNARKSGIHCANIITTTAARRNTLESQFAYSIKHDCATFTESFYDFHNHDELMKVLKSNSQNDMVYLEYNHLQLGETDEWLEARRRESKNEEIFQMDYLNRWLAGGGAPILPQAVIDRLIKMCIDPLSNELFESLIINWFVDPKTVDMQGYYVLGSDTSDNVGRDFTTFVLTDIRDLSVVLSCRCNIANLSYMAKFAIVMMNRFPNAIFIPERNKNGAFLLDIMMVAMKQMNKQFNPFKRIYNKIIDEWDQYKDTVKDIYTTDPTNTVLRRHFGFWTGGGANGTRSFLFQNVMMSAIPKATDVIRDRRIAEEAVTLSVDDKGRIDHSAGRNDDMLVAWLLTAFFIMYAKNQHMYGIPYGLSLSTMKDTTLGLTNQEMEKQKTLRRTIQALRQKVDNPELSPVIRASLGYEVKQLERLLQPIDNDVDIISPMQVNQRENNALNSMYVEETPGNGEPSKPTIHPTIYMDRLNSAFSCF